MMVNDQKMHKRPNRDGTRIKQRENFLWARERERENNEEIREIKCFVSMFSSTFTVHNMFWSGFCTKYTG